MVPWLDRLGSTPWYDRHSPLATDIAHLGINRAAQFLVSIVDDDASVRESLPDLLEARGYDVEAFVSAGDFLSSSAVERTSCLILDVSMPGMTGPELQEVLNRQKRSIPIIFITVLPDDALFARLVSRGAVGCLTKPFSDQELSRALDAALIS